MNFKDVIKRNEICLNTTSDRCSDETDSSSSTPSQTSSNQQDIKTLKSLYPKKKQINKKKLLFVVDEEHCTNAPDYEQQLILVARQCRITIKQVLDLEREKLHQQFSSKVYLQDKVLKLGA